MNSMKKISCIVVILLAIATNVVAQGFYLRLGVGYAFSQAGQTNDGNGEPYNGSLNNSTLLQAYNLKSASFGAGFQGVLGLGYLFSDHVGVQLDAGVGIASKKYTFNDNNVNINGVASDVSVVQQAQSPLILIPSIVLQTGGAPWNIYSRFGLALPLSTKMTQDQIISNAPGTGAVEVDDYTFDIKNSFALGFAAAAGVQYKLNDKVSLWGEVSLLSLSVNIKQSDLTGVTANGQSVSLSQVSGPQTVTYSKNASVDSTGTKEPTYSQPFSNIAINLGVSFKLGRNSHSKSHGRNSRSDSDLIDRPKNARFK